MPKFAISYAVVGLAAASFTRHGVFVRTAGVVLWEVRSGGVFRLLDWREQAATRKRKKAQYGECFNSKYRSHVALLRAYVIEEIFVLRSRFRVLL